MSLASRVSEPAVLTPIIVFEFRALILATFASKHLALVFAAAAREAIQHKEFALAACAKPFAHAENTHGP